MADSPHVFHHTITVSAIKAAQSRLSERGAVEVPPQDLAALLDTKLRSGDLVEILDSWRADTEVYIAKIEIAGVKLVALLVRGNVGNSRHNWTGVSGLLMISACTYREAHKCFTNSQWKTISGQEMVLRETPLVRAPEPVFQEESKTCTKCGLLKAVGEFYKDRDSLRSDCKGCFKDRVKKTDAKKVKKSTSPGVHPGPKKAALVTHDPHAVLRRALDSETEAMKALADAQDNLERARLEVAAAIAACHGTQNTGM